MIVSQPKRRWPGLGQDDSDGDGVLQTINSPVTLQVSPLLLGGVGLLALAFLISGTRKAAGAVSRKGRALRKALRA
jgi:hypothetical protein